MLKKLLPNNSGVNMYIPEYVSGDEITNVNYDVNTGIVTATIKNSGARTCCQELNVEIGKSYKFYGEVNFNSSSDCNIRLFNSLTLNSSTQIAKVSTYSETNPYVYTNTQYNTIYIRWYSYNTDFQILNFTIVEV